jgi:predicted transcriptional regulator
MTIELPRDVEARLKQTALAQGVSLDDYAERLVAESDLRQTHVSEFRAGIAERMISSDAGADVDGEEVMARLIAELK